MRSSSAILAGDPRPATVPVSKPCLEIYLWSDVGMALSRRAQLAGVWNAR